MHISTVCSLILIHPFYSCNGTAISLVVFTLHNNGLIDASGRWRHPPPGPHPTHGTLNTSGPTNFHRFPLESSPVRCSSPINFIQICCLLQTQAYWLTGFLFNSLVQLDYYHMFENASPLMWVWHMSRRMQFYLYNLLQHFHSILQNPSANSPKPSSLLRLPRPHLLYATTICCSNLILFLFFLNSPIQIYTKYLNKQEIHPKTPFSYI